MAEGDDRARKIYETIGTYFGYNLAQYNDRYELKNVLVLGRVMSGPRRRHYPWNRLAKCWPQSSLS